jgi:hypothetical protein
VLFFGNIVQREIKASFDNIYDWKRILEKAREDISAKALIKKYETWLNCQLNH